MVLCLLGISVSWIDILEREKEKLSAWLLAQVKRPSSRFCRNIRKIKVVIKICQRFDKLLLKVISYFEMFIAHMDEGLFINPLWSLMFVCLAVLFLLWGYFQVQGV